MRSILGWSIVGGDVMTGKFGCVPSTLVRSNHLAHGSGLPEYRNGKLSVLDRSRY